MFKNLLIVLMYMFSLMALASANPISAAYPTDIAVDSARELGKQARNLAICNNVRDCVRSGACEEDEECTCYSGRCYPGVEDKRKGDSDENAERCRQVAADAKASVRDQVCTMQVALMACPESDYTYEARNGCEISYLEEHGWDGVIGDGRKGPESFPVGVGEGKRVISEDDDGVRKYEEEIRPLQVERRAVAQENMREAQEKVSNLRARASMAQSEYEEKKADFQLARERIMTCRQDQNCTVDEAQEEVLQRAKEYLLEALDLILLKLEETKARLESSDSIPEERVDAAAERLDMIMNRIEGLSDDIENATTQREIQQATRTLRTAWNTAESDMKRFTYMNAGRKVGLVVRQAELMEHKLECAVESVDGNNSELNDMIESFNEEVAAARTEFESAQEIWDDEESDNLEEARDAIRRGHDHLKRAHEILKEVVRKVREGGGSFEACGAPESTERDDVNEHDDEEMDDDIMDGNNTVDTNQTDMNQTVDVNQTG